LTPVARDARIRDVERTLGAATVGRYLRYKLGKDRREIDRAVRRLVHGACRDVAGYRRLLEETGVRIDGFRGIADLRHLPVVDKETLFRRFALGDVLRRGALPERCVRAGTSGSTGLPLTVFMSRSEAFYRRLLLLLAWRRLAPMPLPLRIVDVGTWVPGQVPVKQRRSPLLDVVRIPIGLPAEEQVRLILRHRPAVLSGYPSALSVLAEAWAESDDGAFPLRLVATRGEVLHGDARRILEKVFTCRVADFYNSEEVGNMAWECPADASSLHVNTDGCVLEVVDDAGDPVPEGTEGRVLVTNLYNWTMPFIRYDLHDRGVMLDGEGRCACGHRGPRMAIIQGRDDDFVILPGGRRVSPRLVATAINRAVAEVSPLGGFDRHFRRFQVIQDAAHHLIVRIVPEKGRSVDFESVIGIMLRTIHPDLRCTVEIVDDLPCEPSGKFKKVVSRIAAL
jgi:phenylacetate-CoA ligase